MKKSENSKLWITPINNELQEKTTPDVTRVLPKIKWFYKIIQKKRNDYKRFFMLIENACVHHMRALSF